MLRCDFHTHTCLCDGKNTPEEMVQAAWRMGLTDYGVSGHADFTHIEPGFGMTDAILAEYKERLLRLRKEYEGRMNLYIGIELDLLGPVQEAEYSIGSVHCVEKEGEYVMVDDTAEGLESAVNRLWNGNWYSFAEDFFRLETMVGEKLRCDFVGHFNLLTKFNEAEDGSFRYFDETADAYLEPALAAMKELARQGLPFEINTGAMSRGYRTKPYPSDLLLRELKAMGGKILINSDSHSAQNICYAFDQAEKLAWDCGFRKVLSLKPGGGFREIDL